jgi:hypothetical protein
MCWGAISLMVAETIDLVPAVAMREPHHAQSRQNKGPD